MFARQWLLAAAKLDVWDYLNPEPYTLNSKLYTLNPKPETYMALQTHSLLRSGGSAAAERLRFQGQPSVLREDRSTGLRLTLLS